MALFDCYECSAPAKFYVFCYGDEKKRPETMMCAVHAVEHAADGSKIERMTWWARELGYEEVKS